MLTAGTGTTDVGLVRTNNEDFYSVDNEIQLYIVCDGVGGNNAGEVASGLACELTKTFIDGHIHILENYLNGHKKTKPILDLINNAVQTANLTVYDSGQENPEFHNMATTFTMLLVVGKKGFYAHIGDSQLYRVQNDEIEMLTTDHTIANEMLHEGTPEEEIPVRFHNILSRAIGLMGHTPIDTLAFDVQHGDRFLLCSDGLTNYVHEDDFIDGLFTLDHEESLNILVQGAKTGGGHDNITAILIDCFDENLI